MPKYRATESRSWPTLGVTLNAGETVDLPEGTNVPFLELVKPEAKAEPKPADKPAEKE